VVFAGLTLLTTSGIRRLAARPSPVAYRG
jgi:hypothetical protein